MIESLYTHFAPSPPLWNVGKTRSSVHPTQVCFLPFSNIEGGSGAADTYSVGITVMISYYWHFPTQFVHHCNPNVGSRQATLKLCSTKRPYAVLPKLDGDYVCTCLCSVATSQ